MSHTPGPWKLELIETFPFGVRVLGANGDVIFSQGAVAHSSKQITRKDCEEGVGFSHHSDNPAFSRNNAVSAIATQDANARLIAAAPDLLEALERVNIFLRGEMLADALLNEGDVTLAEYVRAAIAKATQP